MVTFTHFNIFLLVFYVIVVSVIPNSKVFLFHIIAVLTGSLTFTYVIMFVLYGVICRWKVFLIQVKKYTFLRFVAFFKNSFLHINLSINFLDLVLC